MITVVLKFEINNKFDEWEKAFYSHQSLARASGIYELYHGHAPDNEQKVCVILNVLSEEHMQKFMEVNGAEISASGHILESTVSEIFVN
jgi:hypothetical protein